jgi:hypothetical protein
MRSLNRNKRRFWYALYIEDRPIKDEYGNESGESEPIYGEPVELYGNISAAVGEDVVEAFGNFTNYVRVLCVADVTCPLAERGIVWFGIAVEKPHNYIVTRKADSKNGILYALQEVNVT